MVKPRNILSYNFIYRYYLFYIFIYDLFKDLFRTSKYVASKIGCTK
jgi:hypothetical protein